MRRVGWSVPIGMLAVLVWAGSARWGIPAQEHGDSAPAVTVEEALQRRCRMPFGQPTTLAEVAAHLRTTLRAPVVLDRAALDRLGLTPESTVSLELEQVRLRTALKLLLDQVGLTYRVVPEDNLLILTDTNGSEDRSEQILAELKALHRDVHDLQDTVDELLDTIAPLEPAPEMRNPTIIEELPPGREKEKEKPADPSPTIPSDRPHGRARPG